MAETNKHLRRRMEEEQEQLSVAAAPVEAEVPKNAPVDTETPDLNAYPVAASPAYGGSPTPDPLPE